VERRISMVMLLGRSFMEGRPSKKASRSPFGAVVRDGMR